jgi:hypothetical protein
LAASDPEGSVIMNNRRINRSNPVLWASAFVIFALAITQAGRLAPNPAYAGDAVTTRGGLSLLTASSGTGPKEAPYDLLYVVDSADELLYIYWVENANSQATSKLALVSGSSLPALFNAARR